MLDITGEKADGWLPTKGTTAEYSQMLERIRAAGSAKGRDMDAFTPGMLGYILVGPDEESVERMKQHPLVRMLCILLPSEVFRKLGYTPPFEGHGSGFHDFIPAAADRAEAMRIVEAIAPEVVDYYAFAGTVEKVAEEIKTYQRVGLRHLVMWNVTAFGDPSLAGWSFQAMRDLQAILKGG
jgi:phthiodiolone/phenolphthiodiolone dimycocerosates ketoreductase